MGWVMCSSVGGSSGGWDGVRKGSREALSAHYWQEREARPSQDGLFLPVSLLGKERSPQGPEPPLFPERRISRYSLIIRGFKGLFSRFIPGFYFLVWLFATVRHPAPGLYPPDLTVSDKRWETRVLHFLIRERELFGFLSSLCTTTLCVGFLWHYLPVPGWETVIPGWKRGVSSPAIPQGF